MGENLTQSRREAEAQRREKKTQRKGAKVQRGKGQKKRRDKRIRLSSHSLFFSCSLLLSAPLRQIVFTFAPLRLCVKFLLFRLCLSAPLR
jgi:hypothetical protein